MILSKHIKLLSMVLITIMVISCNNIKKEKETENTTEVITKPTNKVVLSSEVEWQQLNPARGDNSPKAGTIWGNRLGAEATGFLAEFKDGFSSPPHIHNITYRAVVISGLIHNDDPNAKKMWMPSGSFWTQPAGEPHITAAKGSKNIAYVEIDNSPYLVKPTEEAFDNGEQPINISKSNIVWLDASQTSLIDSKNADSDVQMAFLWKKEKLRGNFIKLPNGFKGEIHSTRNAFHAVIIQGEIKYNMPSTDAQNDNEVKNLNPGSYFTSQGKSIHSISTKQETVIYLRTDDDFKVIQQ